MANHVLRLTMDPVFARLLQRQNDNQTFLFPEGIAGMPPDKLSDFIRTQAYALVAEVVESVDETHWKPWATRPADQDVIPNRDRYTSELADVFIFFMNLMLAGGVTMSDLAKAVEIKQDKNMARWQNGYDGKSSKCPGCGRDYGDTGVECAPASKMSDHRPWCSDREKLIQE